MAQISNDCHKESQISHEGIFQRLHKSVPVSLPLSLLPLAFPLPCLPCLDATLQFLLQLNLVQDLRCCSILLGNRGYPAFLAPPGGLGCRSPKPFWLSLGRAPKGLFRSLAFGFAFGFNLLWLLLNLASCRPLCSCTSLHPKAAQPPLYMMTHCHAPDCLFC